MANLNFDFQEYLEHSEEDAGSQNNLDVPNGKKSQKKDSDSIRHSTVIKGIEKISRFIDMHPTTLEDFWRSNRNHASYDDLKGFCEDAGLKLTPDDQLDIMNSLFAKSAIISITEFVTRIQSWTENAETIVMNFLKNRSEKLAQTMKKKVRLNSAHPSRSKDINRTETAETVKMLTRPASSSHYNINKSKEYLRQQKIKQIEVQKKLELAINKAKDEYEYELLIRMGQANDMNKDMQLPTTYRAYKNAQGNLKVRVFNLDKFEKQIKLQEFQREFNNLKKKYNETKKISVWQQLSTTKHSIKADTRCETSFVNRNVKKSERQKQLISVLTETMNLTNLLKGQLKILKAHGIYTKS